MSAPASVTKRCEICVPDASGEDAVTEALPISRWTIPLAVVSVQEGGGLATVTLTVLPPGEFNTPETQVLRQPAVQSKQAVSGRKRNKACESRR